MPLTDEQKRIYASAPVKTEVRQALSLSHPGFTRTYYLTNYPAPFNGVADGALRTFEAVPFEALEPQRDDSAQQDLRLRIDNTSPRLLDELERASVDFSEPILCAYYVFNGTDPRPQNDPPIRLFLTDIEVTVGAVTGTATRADVVNAEFPRRYYRISEFPGMSR